MSVILASDVDHKSMDITSLRSRRLFLPAADARGFANRSVVECGARMYCAQEQHRDGSRSAKLSRSTGCGGPCNLSRCVAASGYEYRFAVLRSAWGDS